MTDRLQRNPHKAQEKVLKVLRNISDEPRDITPRADRGQRREAPAWDKAKKADLAAIAEREIAQSGLAAGAAAQGGLTPFRVKQPLTARTQGARTREPVRSAPAESMIKTV